METPTPKIHAAMIAVMRSVKAIGKDKQNQQQGFKYRGIDDVYLALHQCFADAGIYCRTEVLSRDTTERQTKSGGVLYSIVCNVVFHLCADDGSEIQMRIISEGMDSADKGTNKAIAVAHKYALLQAFLIPTEDMEDPDASSPDPAPTNRSQAQAVPRRQAESAPDPAPPARQTRQAPAPTSGQAQPFATLDRPRLLSGANIIEAHELNGTNSRGPWTAWKFMIRHEGLVYNAGTFNKEVATVALANVDPNGQIAVDLDLKPVPNGKIEIVSVQNADDVPV